MMRRRWTLLLGSLVVLSGCATLPTGPSVMVLPAAGKPFEQFQAEEAGCREWAAQQSGAVPGAPANQQTAVGAAIGTAVGAGLGAAIGSASGHAGTGAAIGAGTGLLMGTAAGANADQVAGGNAQRRYDMAYQQCMYAKGNQRFREQDLRQWHGGHWVHDRHAGRLGWWWVVGGAWYFYPAPVYPYPDPYVPPTVAPPAPPASAPTQYWYYCARARAYYPYVTSCPEGWMQVVPPPTTPRPGG